MSANTDEMGNCKICWGHHPGSECNRPASGLEVVRALLDRAKRQRVVRNDFQEGVMAALLMLVPDITREQFDELMVEKANAYAAQREPE